MTSEILWSLLEWVFTHFISYIHALDRPKKPPPPKTPINMSGPNAMGRCGSAPFLYRLYVFSTALIPAQDDRASQMATSGL